MTYGTAVFACAFTLGTLHAQDAGPIIHAESREVLVDTVAVDKKGHFAQDLAAKDFRIWEDGKEQKISGFSLESSGVSPERSSKHYIALFFDTSSAGQSGQMAARQEGVRFIDGFASPDRYMAVIYYNLNGGIRVGQNFTTDRDLLKKALNLVPAPTNSAPPAPAPVAPVRGGRGGGAAVTPAASDDTVGNRQMLASLRGLADSLATIRGRKALVFFSGGMTGGPELTSDLTATIDACNKANVAVYTVGSGPGGTGSSATSASSSTQVGGRNARPSMSADFATDDQNLIPSLADGTGGIAFMTTNDLAASLGKVAQEQDQYYLLTYTPAINAAEGSCHQLKVKVDRGDLEVRARRSYCTSKPVDLLSGKPAGKDLEARAASGGAGNIAASMQLPWFYSSPNVAKVDLAMDIIPSAMKFQKEKGKFHGEFDLAGVAYKPDGTVAARVSDAVKLDFDTQQQADAFLKAPYHYENQFDIAPGQYNFRMAFSSESSGPEGFGKVEMPLSIAPWNGQTLGESGIALSHDAHPAADLAAGLDESLLEGMRPLVAKGAEIVPTGTVRFHSSDRAFFYLEAYEPLLTAAKPDALPVIGLRLRILDSATGQQKADSGVKTAGSFMRAGNPVVPIVSTLPIAGLPPGAYKMEVSVMRETGDAVVRTVDFDIE